MVLVMGSLLALIFGAVQVGLWFYGRAAVEAAANRGAQVASVSGGTDAAGQQAALAALSTLGGLGNAPQVRVSDLGGNVRVSASVAVASIVPFLPPVAVSSSVVMHREP